MSIRINKLCEMMPNARPPGPNFDPWMHVNIGYDGKDERGWEATEKVLSLYGSDARSAGILDTGLGYSIEVEFGSNGGEAVQMWNKLMRSKRK